MTSHDEKKPAEGAARMKPRNVALIAAGAVVVLGLAAAGIWWGVTNGPASSPVAADSARTPTASSAPGASSAPSPSASGAPATGAPATGSTPAPSTVPGAAGAALPQRQPVAMESTTSVVKGVTVAMTKLESVKGEAEGVGEIAGPAIRFTLAFSNAGAAAYPTQGVVVNVYYGKDNTPALPLSKPGGTTLAASVAAGSTASATYIFTVPEDQRGSVIVTVDYQAGAPAIAFQGAAPK